MWIIYQIWQERLSRCRNMGSIRRHVDQDTASLTAHCMAACAQQPRHKDGTPPCAFLDHPDASSLREAVLMRENQDCMRCIPECVNEWHRTLSDLKDPSRTCDPSKSIVYDPPFLKATYADDTCFGGSRLCKYGNGDLRCQTMVESGKKEPRLFCPSEGGMAKHAQA